MGIILTGVICEQAWKQGDDLYGYDNNRFLAGCEYVAKYNLGEDVPSATDRTDAPKKKARAKAKAAVKRPV